MLFKSSALNTRSTKLDSLNSYALLSRPLDGLEKAFWLLDQNYPTHFSIAAEVVGAISAARWEAALAKLARKYPQSGAQIEVDDLGEPILVVGERRAIPLIVMRGGLDRWEQYLSYEQGRSFDIAKDVLIRVRILHEDAGAVVILTFHHAIADGASALYVLRDLLSLAVGLPVEARSDINSLEGLIDLIGWPASEAAVTQPQVARHIPSYRS